MPDIIRIVIFAAAALVIAAAGLYAVMLMRAANSKRLREGFTPALSLDSERAKHAADALAAAVRFRTVSHEEPLQNENTEWVKLRDQLRKNFPKAHKTLTREIVSDYSLLYIWKAERPKGDPILLCGHLDVVPASGEWEHPPFSGIIDDGYVWGRGALDDKCNIITMLEAIETLIARGASPVRDVYLAFSHDQESGTAGANALSRIFAERGMSFYMVLDEGGWLTKGILPTRLPVAQIGVAEKGRLRVKLTAGADSGMSSSPPAHTAISLMSEAIARVGYRPRKARITPVAEAQLKSVMSVLPFRWRYALVNLPLTRRRLIKLCENDTRLNPLVRSTVAVTRACGGSADNVLPGEAAAFLDIRLLHGDSGDGVLQFIRDVVSGLGVDAEEIDYIPPSPVSGHTSEQFAHIKDCVREVFGNVKIAPALAATTTSARQYERFCPYVYRFSPFTLTPLDQNRLHGVDEGVRVDSLGLAVAFYRELLLKTSVTLSGGSAENEHIEYAEEAKY